MHEVNAGFLMLEGRKNIGSAFKKNGQAFEKQGGEIRKTISKAKAELGLIKDNRKITKTRKERKLAKKNYRE